MSSNETPTVLSAEEIAIASTGPLGNIEGVANTVLWTDGTSMTGVLTIEGGQRLGSHTHRAHLHHLWVLDGSAEIAGRVLHAGSYVHVPPGVEQDIDATQTAGVRAYYSYALPADAGT